jgi:hypothetical protein
MKYVVFFGGCILSPLLDKLITTVSGFPYSNSLTVLALWVACHALFQENRTRIEEE